LPAALALVQAPASAHVPEKWEPVFRKGHAQTKETGAHRDSAQSGCALALALIKPQFEAGRGAVKKGIVRNPLVHAAVCEDIAAFVAGLGWAVAGTMPSPITGSDGNHEFFIAALRR
jgi:hypothetical protein